MTAPLSAPTRVDVGAIERELSALWQSAADQSEEQRSAPVTRTCLVNLVVVARDRAAASQATAVIDRLTSIYPNRAIVATMLPAADADPSVPALDAWVQAHCQLPAPGRPQVCGEQISIEARGEAAVRVPGVVLPLLVPDVSVALWLPRGEPAAFVAATKLADVADRVIVDSSTFVAPEQGLAAVAALLDSDTTVSDLAWARLTGWRELLAQFFDAAAMRRHLAEVERVRIAVLASTEGQIDRSRALLLLGWLTSRLGWSISAPGDLRLRRADGAEVLVTIDAVESAETTPGHLAEIEIGCRQAQFSVARVAGADTVVTRIAAEGMWPMQRTVPLERPDEAMLLTGELQLLGRDRTFESALRMAVQLAG